MKFSELVRLLEGEGFRLVKEKGPVRYHRNPGVSRLIRIDSRSQRSSHRNLRSDSQSGWPEEAGKMIALQYSLVIEATEDANFFSFYSPDLEGFTGVGNSVEDCLYKARWGMEEHVALLREQGLPVPPRVGDPKVTIQNAKTASPVL